MLENDKNEGQGSRWTIAPCLAVSHAFFSLKLHFRGQKAQYKEYEKKSHKEIKWVERRLHIFFGGGREGFMINCYQAVSMGELTKGLFMHAESQIEIASYKSHICFI